MKIKRKEFVTDRDSLDTLMLTALRTYIRCYYAWKRDKVDASGKVFDPKLFGNLDVYETLLKSRGISYNPEKDVFSDEYV